MRLAPSASLFLLFTACGGPVKVAQLDQATLIISTSRSGQGLICEVTASIPPLDQSFVTSGIKATLNGMELSVAQGEAEHDEYDVLSTKWFHVPARGILASTVGTNAALRAPQPPLIELEITDDSGAIHVRIANPCALDDLSFEEPTRASPLGAQFGPAFSPGETIKLSSDPRGSWGSEPVAITLDFTQGLPRTVAATPVGNRLSFIVPDVGFTAPNSASLMTVQRAIVPAFEQCEGVARCEAQAGPSFASLNWTWTPL